MAKIKIEMDVSDEMIDDNTGELTSEGWQEILDAVLPLGENIDIEEL